MKLTVLSSIVGATRTVELKNESCAIILHNQIFKDRLLVSTISVKREYIHQNGRGIYSILKRLSYLYMLNVCSLWKKLSTRHSQVSIYVPVLVLKCLRPKAKNTSSSMKWASLHMRHSNALLLHWMLHVHECLDLFNWIQDASEMVIGIPPLNNPHENAKHVHETAISPVNCFPHPWEFAVRDQVMLRWHCKG